MLIRYAEITDAAGMRYITGMNYGGRYDEHFKKEFAISLTHEYQKFVVAYEDGVLQGFASFAESWMTYDIYEITWVNVDQVWQRKGVGKKLVNFILDEIKAKQAIMVMLTSNIPDYYVKHFGFTNVSAYESKKPAPEDGTQYLQVKYFDGQTK